MQFLNEEFLSQYPDRPEFQNELGAFLFYRTYSRWLEGKGRRETFKEMVRRSVEYNIGLGLKRFEENNIDAPIEQMAIEAETLFDNIFNLRQFLSGRTHWVGGADTGVADKFPLANFNCSFLNISKWSDLADAFYLLLVGTGVGFRSTPDMAKEMKPIRNNFNLTHMMYIQKPKSKRLENTFLHKRDDKTVEIEIGDSKEGWVTALNLFFTVLTEPEFNQVTTIYLNYNSIRPRGEKLKTFGGHASGHESLRDMFIGIEKVIKGQIEKHLAPPEEVYENHVQLRPIHFLDIMNLIGNNVVVGGVRRTAEMGICAPDDWEFILAKYGINGIWDTIVDGEVIDTAEDKRNRIVEKLQKLGVETDWIEALPLRQANIRPIEHRRMSNNSIAFTEKPSPDMMDLLREFNENEGEPGFFNLAEARRRRPNAEGLNPCAEIILDSYGVCNLTTVNVMSFVEEKEGQIVLDFQGLMQAQALSTRAGMRMATVELEIPHWDKVAKRDFLIGTSLTGWQDAMEALGYDEQQEINLLELLKDTAHTESVRYAFVLRSPIPLLATTVKPEGTLSKVANQVSNGLHVNVAPYYIQRIRINADDPLAKVAQELGWTIHPEVGFETLEEARTWVIDFPVKSEATKSKGETDAMTQLDTYFRFNKHYATHNSSNTIHIRKEEWKPIFDRIYEEWDNFVAVSFLSWDNNTYQLQPQEEITEEEYHKLKNSMKPFDEELLKKYEKGNSDDLEFDGSDCEAGICAIR